jgi:hypothetical protein
MEWKKEQFRIVDDSAEISVDFVSRLLAKLIGGITVLVRSLSS